VTAENVEMHNFDPYIERLISKDERVQTELRELNHLLRQLSDVPESTSDLRISGNYVIDDDSRVTRWELIVTGEMNLRRIAHFRDKLMDMPYIIEARTIAVSGAAVTLRLSTVGDVSRTGLEHALTTMRIRSGVSIDLTINRNDIGVDA
jgi:hypothetical protein